MSETNNKNLSYSKYLQKRRISGFIYRFIFVYPFFLKYLGDKNYDYGCGVGDFLIFAKIFKKTIIGLDVNNENLKICQNRNCNVDLLEPKRKYFKYKKNSVDCIVLDNVLEHISLPKEAIKDIYMGLKSNGYLIIAVPVGKKGYNSDPDHKVYYDENKLDDLITLFNFVKCDLFYRPLNNSWMRENMRQFCYYSIYKKKC
jgi:ubiquinone/menaquinone biosynthesis C-methylase UbiE